MTREIVAALLGRLEPGSEDGAVGWLVLGIVIGVILVIVGIVQLVIPGD